MRLQQSRQQERPRGGADPADRRDDAGSGRAYFGREQLRGIDELERKRRPHRKRIEYEEERYRRSALDDGECEERDGARREARDRERTSTPTLDEPHPCDRSDEEEPRDDDRAHDRRRVRQSERIEHLRLERVDREKRRHLQQ